MDPADVEFVKAMLALEQAEIDLATKYLAKTSPAARKAQIADFARSVLADEPGDIKELNSFLRGSGNSRPGA